MKKFWNDFGQIILIALAAIIALWFFFGRGCNTNTDEQLDLYGSAKEDIRAAALKAKQAEKSRDAFFNESQRFSNKYGETPDDCETCPQKKTYQVPGAINNGEGPTVIYIDKDSLRKAQMRDLKNYAEEENEFQADMDKLTGKTRQTHSQSSNVSTSSGSSKRSYSRSASRPIINNYYGYGNSNRQSSASSVQQNRSSSSYDNSSYEENVTVRNKRTVTNVVEEDCLAQLKPELVKKYGLKIEMRGKQAMVVYPDGTPYKGEHGHPFRDGTKKEDGTFVEKNNSSSSSGSPKLKPGYRIDSQNRVVDSNGNTVPANVDPFIR